MPRSKSTTVRCIERRSCALAPLSLEVRDFPPSEDGWGTCLHLEGTSRHLCDTLHTSWQEPSLPQAVPQGRSSSPVVAGTKAGPCSLPEGSPTCLHLSVDSPSRPMAGPAESSGALASGPGVARPSHPLMFLDPPRRSLHWSMSPSRSLPVVHFLYLILNYVGCKTS